MNKQSDIAEIEDCMNFNAPLSSSVMPRWQRKALQGSTTPSRRRSADRMTPTPKRKKLSSNNDRFIPSRGAMDLDVAHYNMTKENGADGNVTPNKAFGDELAKSLFDSSSDLDNARVLAFRNKAPAPKESYQDSLKVLYSQNKAASTKQKVTLRHIPSAPEKILDAPDLVDDYYLNLLDWGSNNVLAVALGQVVYLWNATTGSIEELMELEGDDYVCSVSWLQGGNFLSIGTNSSTVQLWDTEKMKQVRSMKGHQARVGSLAWNSHVLSSGSRDSNIMQHDVRIAQHHIATLSGHSQEVCGLKWSPDGTQLASGGNDNLLNIWDARSSGVSGGVVSANAPVAPRLTLRDHTAAVKAVAWCPWKRNLLASGGGTADRCIKMWNTGTGACLQSVDTGSQVCSLLWSTTEKELLSSHGFSQNQLCLWKYPSMLRVKELTGHTSRVLHLAASPDGQTVCSAAADETLRFWKVFAPASGKRKRSSSSSRGGAASERVNLGRTIR